VDLRNLLKKREMKLRSSYKEERRNLRREYLKKLQPNPSRGGGTTIFKRIAFLREGEEREYSSPWGGEGCRKKQKKKEGKCEERNMTASNQDRRSGRQH